MPKYITIITELGNEHIVNKKLYYSKLLYNVLLNKSYNFYIDYKYTGINQQPRPKGTEYDVDINFL